MPFFTKLFSSGMGKKQKNLNSFQTKELASHRNRAEAENYYETVHSGTYT